MSLWDILSEIVSQLLIMSVTGSIVALLMLGLKPLIKNRLPKNAQYYLWVLVLVAFLVPFSSLVSLPFATPMSQLQEVIDENIMTTNERYENIAQEQHNEPFESLQTNEQIKIIAENKTRDYNRLLLIPFTCGAMIFLANIFQYCSFSSKLRRCRTSSRDNEIAMLNGLNKAKRKPRLYRTQLAPTPMLLGIFRPVIYLPERECSEQQLQNIMLHELTHLQRHDVVIKWIAAIAVYVHWFNPIAYFVRRELDRSCELACDEAVINNLNTDEKQSYGDTLIEMASNVKKSRVLVSTTMCEEKKTLKERLGAIMHSKKHTKSVIQLSCALLVILLGAIVLFGASSNYNDCSTLEGRELRLREISNLGDETTISQELVIDDYIISGYTTKNNRYGLAVFATDGNGAYRFQTNVNRFNDELVFMTATINHKLYNVYWANKADLDYAELTYTMDGNIEETIKLDAKDNKIIYTDAPSNDFSVEYYFFDVNGNRYD